jgi:hypothetical protein
VVLALALAFTLACVAASALRLSYVTGATPVDPSAFVAGVRAAAKGSVPASLTVLDSLLASVPATDWERDVLRAVGEPAELRPALIGEAMTDLDFRARRWLRVPRVCASLSSSFGFLLATVALRVGLSDLAGALDPEEVLSVNAAVLDAIDVAALGLVGTAFCMAIQYRARTTLAARLAGAERFVELMERLGARRGEALADALPRGSVQASQAAEEPSPAA